MVLGVGMPSDAFPLVDRILGGGLVQFLDDARAAGESHETIARRLSAEHAIDVTGETVRRWCARPASSGVPQ